MSLITFLSFSFSLSLFSLPLLLSPSLQTAHRSKAPLKLTHLCNQKLQLYKHHMLAHEMPRAFQLRMQRHDNLLCAAISSTSQHMTSSDILTSESQNKSRSQYRYVDIYCQSNSPKENKMTIEVNLFAWQLETAIGLFTSCTHVHVHIQACLHAQWMYSKYIGH